MVFQDLSQYSKDSAVSDSTASFRIAPVSDRVLAFCFDVALFSPLFTLILSRIFQKIELRYYTDPGSLEFSVLLGLGVFGIAALTLFTQAYCLWRWGATPGKYFFKLKVLSINEKKLTFVQTTLRSILWILEFCAFGLAFFEILSQKQRRPLHDRAAETMVVTLKIQGDQGPHPLEAHFVRNLLLMFSTVILLWGTVFIGQIYRMATQGEFKKMELEENEFLCSAISTHVEKDQTRLDLAIAQFLAGEIEEDCLLSESDFSLWTGEKNQLAWGYFAKSIFYQFDQEKSNEYLGKVCISDRTSEACRLAQALQTQNRNEILKAASSLTGQIMQIREFTNRGDFSSALKSVTKLSASSAGFEKYTQKQTVKYLWMLGRKEEAAGAYMNTWKFMAEQDQADLASWLCLENVNDRCENKNYKACNDLKENLKETSYTTATTESLIGLVMEAECKNSHDLSLISFQKILEGNESLKNLVLALSSESEWSSERRLASLRQLSFDSEANVSRLVQRRAQMVLLDKSKNVEDSLKLLELLRGTEKHDWVWQSLMQKISHLAEKKNYAALAIELQKIKPQLKNTSNRIPASETEP